MNRAELVRQVPMQDVLEDRSFREILWALNKAGVVRISGLENHLFCAQELKATEANYEFFPTEGMCLGDDLHPVSPDLRYDVESLTVIGAIDDCEGNLKLSDKYRMAITNDHSFGAKEDFVAELAKLSEGKLEGFAKRMQLRSLLLERSIPENEVNARIRGRFEMDDPEMAAYTERVGKLQQLATG